jgi:hypothetical protein
MTLTDTRVNTLYTALNNVICWLICSISTRILSRLNCLAQVCCRIYENYHTKTLRVSRIFELMKIGKFGDGFDGKDSFHEKP